MCIVKIVPNKQLLVGKISKRLSICQIHHFFHPKIFPHTVASPLDSGSRQPLLNSKSLIFYPETIMLSEFSIVEFL